MFRLEKVFQNDDRGYIYFVNLIKTFVILLSLFIFIILKENTIYELFEFNLFFNSKIFEYCLLLTLCYFVISFFLKNNSQYNQTIKYYIKKDVLILVISNILIFIYMFLSKKFVFDNILNHTLLNLFILINLFLLNLYFNYLYNFLIRKNIIQRNIMLVGSYQEIKKILRSNLDNIYIFKCCIITDIKNQKLRLVKSEIKFPIFSEHDDIRTILEYHHLGQIWILNADKHNKKNIYQEIFKYSVDTLNIKLDLPKKNLYEKRLITNLYECEFFEKSKFYGINLFLKIIFDKILSIFFLLLFSPFFIISAIAIYVEDGFPIIFVQNRTGWDGRRFKILKLRSLKKIEFDKKIPVQKNDERLLKCGKFIRRWGIDELPQFFNVLQGDMSIVGPKPNMVEHDIGYSTNFNNFLKRYKCNPGLTGWSQIHGLRGSALKPEMMKKRMVYDLWYLNNWNILLDFYIILKTVFALIKYKGSEN